MRLRSLLWAAHHHPSHVNLVRREPHAPRGRVDAIVVPTARPVDYLRSLLTVAAAVPCPVLALCSKYAKANEIVAAAADYGTEIYAVDVDPGAGLDLPVLETSSVFAEEPAWSRFERKADTSLKRNIGLAAARMAGWHNVVFLDDDIDVTPEDLRTAAGLLPRYDAVGLANTGFADNSVVCHGRRAVGDFQDSFIGGGALAVPVDRLRSFFPNIYNEDWFFLLDDGRLSRVAVTGQMEQKPFDPFADPSRARSEELGDCLAEGLYAVLDTGGKVQDADRRFWRRFLEHRGRLITGVVDRIPALADRSDAEKGRMIEALEAAQERRRLITPNLCVRYLEAWAADRERWCRYLTRLPRRPVPDALLALGLKPGTDAFRSRVSNTSS